MQAKNRLFMLNSYRKKIDKIDKKISDLLIKRYKVVKAIGDVKQEQNLPVRDYKREEESLRKLLSSKELTESEKQYIAGIFSEIHRISREAQ